MVVPRQEKKSAGPQAGPGQAGLAWMTPVLPVEQRRCERIAPLAFSLRRVLWLIRAWSNGRAKAVDVAFRTRSS
jgi:hypothetical protein